MNLSYEPPTRQLLSGQLLEQQLAVINQKTDNIFKQYTNLTLGKYIFIFLNYFKY